ncbi:MAG: VWA domain-containing protein [Acidobacteria bacterium]|nr:VWA domain-containing protein [Acidobacteriota bacterium]
MYRTLRNALALACSLFFLLSGGAEAQQDRTLREEVSINIIEVPVTVVDRSGNPVRGLGSSDFELYDNGAPVPIQHFETIDVQNMPVTRSINPVARLHVVLLFDLSNSTPGSIERSREAAIGFVSEELRPSDLVAVVTFSVEQGLRPVTSFTADRDLLKLAIETLGHPKFFHTSDPLLLSGTSLMDAGGGVGQASGFDVGDMFLSISEEMDRMNRRVHEEYLRKRLESQLDSFGEFARLLDGVRGRKQIVLLTEGFEPRLIQGRERTTAEAREELDAIASGQPWRVDPDQRYGFTSAKTTLSKMARLFKRSDVVLHAIDIKGLRTDVDAQTGFGRRSNESLFLLANPTGGQVFKNANHLSDSFEEIIKQQEVVYLLGFPARLTGREGHFHELEVKIKGVPGAKITHRSGYYEPSSGLSDFEKAFSTADILVNDIPQNELDLSTLAVPFLVEGEDWKVPVIIEIPGYQLLEEVPGPALDAELFIYAFDQGGSVHDFHHQRISLDLEKLRTALEQIGIKFYGVLRVPTGNYAIKALLRVDQSSRSGFTRRDIRASGEDEPLLLPPLVLEEEGKWLMLKAEPRSAEERVYPFHLGSRSFVPSAGAVLEEGEMHQIALFAYNIDYGSGLRAGVRSADGTSRDANLSVIAHAPGSGAEPSKLLVELDTTGLTAGVYHLDFAVGEGTFREATSLPFTMTDRNDEIDRKPPDSIDPADEGEN